MSGSDTITLNSHNYSTKILDALANYSWNVIDDKTLLGEFFTYYRKKLSEGYTDTDFVFTTYKASPEKLKEAIDNSLDKNLSRIFSIADHRNGVSKMIRLNSDYGEIVDLSDCETTSRMNKESIYKFYESFSEQLADFDVPKTSRASEFFFPGLSTVVKQYANKQRSAIKEKISIELEDTCDRLISLL